MNDQLAEMPPLRRALTGDWRDKARAMNLDLENNHYRGFAPYGGTRGDVPVEGDINIVDEGEDYVVFNVSGAHTMTARRQGNDEIVLSVEGGEDGEGVVLRRP